MSHEAKHYLVLKLHEDITLFTGINHPQTEYTEHTKDHILSVYPLKMQQFETGLITTGLMKVIGENKYAEDQKLFAPFKDSYLEDIKLAMHLIENLNHDNKTIITARQAAPLYLMFSGLFWNADILWPEVLR